MERIIKNCIVCEHHIVEPDPDPTDWFDDDDVKVRCKLSKKPQRVRPNTTEPYITVACRPYNTVKECNIPDWCPLIQSGGSKNA